MTRISCEQQDIAFFRFSPVIGKDVGTTERDNHKLCDIIIRYIHLLASHPGGHDTLCNDFNFAF